MTRLLDQKNMNSTRRNFLKTTAAVTLGSAALAGSAMGSTMAVAEEVQPAKVDISSLPRVKQVMVVPPFLPGSPLQFP